MLFGQRSDRISVTRYVPPLSVFLRGSCRDRICREAKALYCFTPMGSLSSASSLLLLHTVARESTHLALVASRLNTSNNPQDVHSRVDVRLL